MSRRVVASAAGLAAALLIATALWITWQWGQAIRHVDMMVVEPVALPTRASPGAGQAGLPTATPAPRFEEPLNILLLGTDVLPGAEVGRTDVMVLVHIDPQTGRAALLSFPRDLWVSIPGQGEARINAAYPFGERRIGPGYGPALAKETVGELVNLPVDHFALINFEGFIKLIDELGGVYVDVPKPLTDPDFPLADRRIRVHFDAGRQLMDGSRALTYVRTRHEDGDLGRNRRQQQVLLAIFERLRDRGLLTNITGLDEYTEVLKDYIRTDLTRGELLQLLAVAATMERSDIERFAIGSEMLVPLDPPATFAVKPAELRKLVAQLCAGTCPPESLASALGASASGR
jgi:polyisoprenyl-teichoic acid--peptidoglycan teichoic acid transferase